jgi:REP element-mobilizing transposase RayT
MPKRPGVKQLDLPLGRRASNGRGGFRPGAGRPKGARSFGGKGRPNVPHRVRPEHVGRYPVHVTLRAAKIGGTLRQQRVLSVLEAALRRVAAAVPGFQIVHYSIQRDHVHLILEAEAPRKDASGARAAATALLRRGVSGLAVSLAKRINRLLHRKGRVWSDRHHRRDLATPTEVRKTLLYVLKNAAHHGVLAPAALDPFSSARGFAGWSHPLPAAQQRAWCAAPRTWLLGVGWQRAGGPLRPDERPRLH